MKQNLTDRLIQSIRPDGPRLTIADTTVQGLEIRVTEKGVKTFAVRFRVNGSRGRETIGTYPAVTLAKARKRALSILARAADGDDPRQKDVSNMTVGQLASEYVEVYATKNQKSWKETKRLLEKHVAAQIGNLKIADLRRGDIVGLMDRLQNDGLTTQVNRVQTKLKEILNWAVDRGYIQASPAAGMNRPIKEISRDRLLAPDELRALWKVIETLSEPSKSMLKTLLLTGQRRDEVRLMQWSEINFEEAVWVIPAERTKPKRIQVVPLSAAMVELLRNQQTGELMAKAGYVFTVNGDKPYAGHKRLKQRLDELSGVTGWIFHDLRRTVASGMAELKIPEEVVRRILNHATKGITAVYNRHDYLDEKREALNAWAERLEVIVNEGHDAPNVVEFRSE